MLALKELIKEDKVPQVLEAFKRKISCFIVHSANDAAMMNYGHIRGNQLNSQFVKKPLAQDLFHVYGVLKKETGESSKDLLKTLERFAIFQLVRDEDISAIKRICQWNEDHFKIFLEVLSKYEHCQTLGKPSQNQNHFS